MEINIRKADIKDVDSLYKLGIEFTKFNADTSKNHDEFFHKNWETDFYIQSVDALKKDNHVIYIASVDNADVGYVHCYVCDDCSYCILDELFVQSEYRHFKIGKLFVDKFVEWSLHYNLPLRVEVFTWNTNAIEFYKKMGFTINSVVLEKPL